MKALPGASPVEPLHSPAADRNKGPILAVLGRVLPATGIVLEIASGTGQHVVHFAAALPNLTWQPTDPDAPSRRSIHSRIADAHLPNVHAPIELDVRRKPWPVAACDAIVCINMIHISAWPATLSLFEGAGELLGEAGILYLYGPYRVGGANTASSNDVFDRSLRAQDPEWGVRDLEAVEKVAADAGFELVETVPMPANNLSVVFGKRGRGRGSAR